MGWELSIRGNSSTAPQALGARQAVCEHFEVRLTGLKLNPWPQAFADHMKAKLAALGVPCVPRLEGNYNAGDLSIEFSCADAETILEMSANVRGNGNPLPALRALCAGTSWVVIEDATGNCVLDSVEASDA
jgi:hypothetical protein